MLEPTADRVDRSGAPLARPCRCTVRRTATGVVIGSLNRTFARGERQGARAHRAASTRRKHMPRPWPRHSSLLADQHGTRATIMAVMAPARRAPPERGIKLFRTTSLVRCSCVEMPSSSRLCGKASSWASAFRLDASSWASSGFMRLVRLLALGTVARVRCMADQSTLAELCVSDLLLGSVPFEAVLAQPGAFCPKAPLLQLRCMQAHLADLVAELKRLRFLGDDESALAVSARSLAGMSLQRLWQGEFVTACAMAKLASRQAKTAVRHPYVGSSSFWTVFQGALATWAPLCVPIATCVVSTLLHLARRGRSTNQ